MGLDEAAPLLMRITRATRAYSLFVSNMPKCTAFDLGPSTTPWADDMWQDLNTLASLFPSTSPTAKALIRPFKGEVGFLEVGEYNRHLITSPLNPHNTMLTLGPPTGPHYTVYVI